MKKILIITYYWPTSGGGGVQRWLKFATYLTEYGVQPVVIVPENAAYPILDKNLENEVPKNIEVIKVPIWEPYSLLNSFKNKDLNKKLSHGIILSKQHRSFGHKLTFWIRGNLLIPDPRVFWVKNVVERGAQLIAEHNIDTVVTTGPPHSVHLAGLRLQKKNGIKWVSDFRDPWSTIDYLDEFYLTSLAKKVHRRLERKVLEKSDCVLAVSENWKNELMDLGAKKVRVITNGYDETDFENYDPLRPSKFNISHVGFLSFYRFPKILFRVLDDLCRENGDFRQDLELRFIGLVDALLPQIIGEYEYLKEQTMFIDYLPHDEVIRKYAESELLLLILNNTQNAMGHIPGKLFEYLASKKSILAVGPKQGDVAGILSDTKAGFIVEFDDEWETREMILQLYDRYLGKKAIETGNIERFTRRKLTQTLAETIKQL